MFISTREALMERAATRLGAAVAIVALLGVLAAFYAVRASGAEHLRVVMTATNKKLGEKILVNRKGMTLYSLSVERKGKFICTNKTCLSLWRPLTVPKGDVPSGVTHLTVVKRPDSRLQVAYRGGPLYTFAMDTRRGDVKGNGFKDVGVWRVAAVSSSSTPPSTSTSGGGYGP
jgi:predicted lipoprotein with Yx(FWY)xxD motif